MEAQAKRVIKEATWTAKGKGKYSRKQKSSTLKVEEDTIEEDATEEDTAGTARYGRKHKSAVPALANKAQISNTPKPASTLIKQASRI